MYKRRPGKKNREPVVQLSEIAKRQMDSGREEGGNATGGVTFRVVAWRGE